jgi:hypothetical protein
VALPFLLYLLARELGSARGPAAALAFLATAPVAPYLNLRPQIFSYDAMVGLLWLIARERNGKSGLFWVIPLTVAWAQMHGSFLFVPCFLALALLSARPWRIGWVENPGFRRPWRLAAALVVSLLAPLANPNGFGLWRDVVMQTFSPLVHRYIGEWGPPPLANPAGEFWWFIPAGAVLAVLLFATRPRMDAYGLVLAAGCVWEAYASERMLPYAFLAVFGFLLAAVPWGETQRFPFRWLNAFFAAALVIFLYLLWPYPGPTVAASIRTGGTWGNPARSLQCIIARHLQRTAIPPGLAAYEMWDGIPTMMDARADFFINQGLFLPFAQVEDGQKPPAPFFHRWRVGAVAWFRHSTVTRELVLEGWRPVCPSQNMVVLLPN